MTQLSDEDKIEAIAEHMKAIIELLGEDPAREGLRKTPVRAAKALWHVTQGYRTDPDALLKQALFEHEGSQMVVVKDIEFYSMCEHHILPFFGKVSIGYIPDGRIVGLSKLARIVNVYAQRLQVQERFTAQIAEKVSEIIGAKGVIVICSGEHLCMKMRGVEKQNSATQTVHYLGEFESPALRAEFMEALRY
ncbi:MAG: GTP cyclohydrolase I FolE [Muribaculaceae bacterium]|nr:GTP cyclohydrolase I FolE [Muribaculaceae bacterium]MDE6574748.1 GTP cyclohydrolase I FolE [Muribaculaceae bacterium]